MIIADLRHNYLTLKSVLYKAIKSKENNTMVDISVLRVNPYSAEIFCINHGDQRVIFNLKSP